jgi:hypothetical protein
MSNLYKITQPGLIIRGAKDRVLPLRHAYLDKEKLPNAKLEIIEGCRLIPLFERSDEFDKLILTFLSERFNSAMPLCLGGFNKSPSPERSKHDSPEKDLKRGMGS